MLQHSDLDSFVALVRRAESIGRPRPGSHPDVVLRTEGQADNLLHRNECDRLQRSLRIACVAGDTSESPHRILDAIVRSLTAEDRRYLPLAHAQSWLSAIQWAIPRAEPSPVDSLRQGGLDRQFHVGTACRRLRDCGHPVPIGALGPSLDGNARRKIAEQVDSLIRHTGGVEAIQRLCGFVGATGRVHDGMWLLGNLTGSYDRAPNPAIPIGWLLSIALRHVHVKPPTGDPDASWKSAIELAVDFAASMDCQRYNPFDGFSLDAPDFLPALEESVIWRELFTLPQVPPLVLPTVRDAFSQVPWPEGTGELRHEVDQLFFELDDLIPRLSVDSLTAIPERTARSTFPLLYRYAAARQGTANERYLDPFGHHPRDHDRYVFFRGAGNLEFVLPSPLTSAAACEAIFRLVWTKAGREKAACLVGDTLEKSAAIACRRTHHRVWEKATYCALGKKLEIDVAVRNGQDIVLLETKAKTLTSQARAGNMVAFINDYSNSFLALLRQLVRHDRNIRRGLTPLTAADDEPGPLRIRKVAVSPISFGPASDHVLTNALIHSIAQAQLVSVDGTPEHARILGAFNDFVKESMREIDQVALHSNGQVDLVTYMMDVLWFDLGQFLYVLHRGHSAIDGVSALSHLTFGTRDFWTEAALADRKGLTKRNWRPS